MFENHQQKKKFEGAFGQKELELDANKYFLRIHL